MYVPEKKPKIYLNDVEVDNISPNKKVFFVEEGHHYFHADDIVDGKIVDFEKSKNRFKSPTGILGNFYEHFDAIPISERYVKKHKLEITPEELRAEWAEKARVASERGSKLHAYCESLYDGWDFGEDPEEVQAIHARAALADIAGQGWSLAKTELLVYSEVIKLSGQVDLLVKRGSDLAIMDYKFLKGPLDMKSYYNRFTRKYKMMSGPFYKLMDTNYNHYSIQMELYRMLMGSAGKKVTNKTLVIVLEDGYELVEGLEMVIWVDKEGNLQSKYKLWNGKVFNSSEDWEYMENPFKLI